MHCERWRNETKCTNPAAEATVLEDGSRWHLCVGCAMDWARLSPVWKRQTVDGQKVTPEINKIIWNNRRAV